MRAYERFLDYVKIHTTSDENCDAHPSSQCQFDLARLLEKQMKELGLQNVLCLRHPARHSRVRSEAGHRPHRPHGHRPRRVRRKREAAGH